MWRCCRESAIPEEQPGEALAGWWHLPELGDSRDSGFCASVSQGDGATAPRAFTDTQKELG